jgi:hypothetical protein
VAQRPCSLASVLGGAGRKEGLPRPNKMLRGHDYGDRLQLSIISRLSAIGQPGLARQPMHSKVDARPHPPGSTCCISLHAAAEMLGDPARKKGRPSMDLWRSNGAHTTQGAAVYCHCGLVYGARVARGCPCNVISQPVSQGSWSSSRGREGSEASAFGRQARGPLIITLTAA